MNRLGTQFVLGLSVLFLCGSPGLSQQPSFSPQPDELIYRQVKVNEGDIDEVLEGTVPLLRSQFEEMINAVNRLSRQSTEALPEFRQGGYIRQSMYYGRVQGGQIIDGRAVLSIDADPDEQGLIPLLPLSVALETPQWVVKATADAPAASVRAICGVTERNIPLLRLNGPGELNFNWSLKGDAVIESERKFNFEVPQSESSYLILDLPSEVLLRSSSGIVWAPDKEDLDLPVEGLPDLAEENIRWVIQLGSQSKTTLTVLSGDALRSNANVLFYSQDLQYSFERDGLELVSRLTLDSVNAQRQSLSFQLSPELELVRVSTQGQALNPTPSETDENRWSITLDSQVGVVNLEVVAVAKFLPLQPQALPLMSVVNGIWRQGQIALTISEDLELYRLDVRGAIESRIEFAGSLKRRVLEMFDPNPHIVVVAGHQETELHISQVSRYEFVDNRVDLQTEIRMTAASEPLHQLHLEITEGWELKSVTLAGKDFGSQQFIPRVVQLEQGGLRVHQINLQGGVESGQTVTLRLNLSYQLKGKILSGELLHVISYPNIAESILQLKKVVLQQHILGLTAEQPNVLQVLGLGGLPFSRLDPASEQVSAEPLLRDVGIVFDSTSRLLGLQISSVSAAQAFEAELETDVTVLDVVTEETRIDVSPLGTPVKQVVVYSSGLSPMDMQWRLEENSDSLVQFEEISNVSLTEEDGWLRWQIDLVEARVTSFKLIGTRSFSPEQFVRLPLYRVDGAQSFSGSVEIGWSEDIAVEVSREPSMERVLPERLRRQATVFCQAFEYGLPIGTPPQVSITSDSELQGHVIWNAHVHSKYLVHGFSSHELRYVVERSGLKDLEVDLPPQVEVESVWVDGQRIYLASIRSSGSPSQLRIPLETESRFARVRIRFKTTSDALGFRTELQKPLPLVNAEILQSYWSVAVPPGFELASRSTEYSVATRLFGPWLKHDQLNISPRYASRSQADNSLERKTAEVTSLLERAAAIRRNSEASPQLTWASWLRNVQFLLSEEFEGLELAVDVVALDALGIDPMTQLSSDVNEAIGTSAIQWLHNAGLALVRDDSRLILSSDRWIDVDALSTGRVIVVSDRLRPVFTTYELAGGSVVQLEDWVLGRRVLSLLSEREVRQLHETLRQDLMWTYESGVKQADAGISLVVYNKASLVTAAWASLVIWIGLLLWLSRRYWKLSFLLPGIMAAFTMFVDEAFVEFGAQAFVASLAVTVCTIVSRMKAVLIVRKADSDLEFDLQSRPGLAAPLLVLAFVVFSSLDSQAYQQPEESLSPQKVNQEQNNKIPVVHSVYLPVDDDGSDAGEYLYVVDEFYQKLTKWYTRADQPTENWLISQAQYQVNWITDTPDGDTVYPALQITYQMELGADVEQITLPFDAQQVEIQSVTIEGEATEYQFQADRKAVQIKVSQEGPVTVEIELEPVVQTVSDVQRFEIDIPGVPEATVETSPVSEEHKVLFLGVQGRTRVDALGGRLVAALGSTRRMGVIWGGGDVEIAGASVLESQEYYWLKIAPHSVVVDVRMKVDVVAGTTQQFSINVDPRLRLLPIRPGQMIVSNPRIRDGETKTLYFSLQRPVSDSFEVQLSFYLEDVSGIGNVPVPEVTPVVQRRRERWLALSVEPDLTWHSPLTTVSDDLKQDLLSRWGAPDVPQAVYALSEIGSQPVEPITTLPRVVKSEVVQSSNLVVGFDQLLMLYHADLLIEDGLAFQQRYLVPKGFVIESATIHQDGVVLDASVQHSTDGYLSVFTDDGITGEVAFELRGRLPLDYLSSGEQRSQVRTLSIPTITHEGGIVINDNINVIQQAGSLVRILSDEDLDLEPGSYVESLGGRLLASFDSSLAASQCTIRILRNKQSFRGAASGGFGQENGKRTFEVTADLKVTEGAVDQIRLQLQNLKFQQVQELSGNYVVEFLQNGPESYLFTLRPMQLIVDSVQFRLKFELEETDGILALPGFEFANNPRGNVQQFFYAPDSIDEQQVEWESVGAQRISQWSTNVIPEVVNSKSHAVFLGTNETEIRSEAFFQSSSKLEVEVASYELAVIDPEHIVGVATFYVLPIPGKDLTLVWPEMWNLENAAVQGTPVVSEVMAVQVSTSEQQRRVVIPLLSDRQYQQVDVVFTLESERALVGGRSLLMLPVPESEVLKSTIEILASDADYKGLQFDSDNVQPDSLAAVFSHQVAWGQKSVLRQIAGNFEVSDSLSREQEYWQKYQNRLQLLQDLADRSPQNLELSGLPQVDFGYRDYQLLQAPGIRLAGHTSGALSQVLIRSQLHTSSVLIWWQLSVILGVLLISGFVYVLTERGWLASWVSHAPMSPLVLLGVIWWTFFTPQLVGVVLIVMALVGLLLPDRRFIKVRFHGLKVN
ncbi:MAG: hypothetical protein CMM02_03295 [Rhodopirellula sp.]|nr:hypothetical protein [Rhodopirellula sp.]